MSILCCCRKSQLADKKTQTEAIGLPTQPPRARLSKTLTRSDTDMYISSILASRGPSRLVVPAYHNIVDPDTVEVDDSDEDGPERGTRPSNIGALGSLRAKLVRRLSHRADTKSTSRPSVGASEEELARRAELRRLMHKRIQEELKSEEEEDDLRLAPPRQPSINNCKEPELCGGGPRDTIEFSVSSIDEQEDKREPGILPETSICPPSIIHGSHGSYTQRTSCSESAKKSLNNSYYECSQSLNEMEPSLRPPSPPHLSPVHLLGGDGRDSPSTVSWRLSCSAIHIESYIEPLVEARSISRPQSPELDNLSARQEDDTAHEADTTTNFSNPTLPDETVDTSSTIQLEQLGYPERKHRKKYISSHSIEASDGRYSPLDMWLRTQDLHCASILSSRSNSEMALERSYELSAPEKVEGLRKPENLAGLSRRDDHSVNSSSILREYAPGAGPKIQDHIIDEVKSSFTTPNGEAIALRRVLNQMENALPSEDLDPVTEDQARDVSSRYTSSRYTTRPNSRQGTPRGSGLSLSDIAGSRKTIQPLSPLHGPVNPYRIAASDNSDISSYRTALNKTPSSDHARPQAELSQFSSISASETASFRQREEELKSIKKRFGLAPARLSPIVPVRSKFREEFEYTKASSTGKSSILSKLHLTLPKRAVASGSHTESNRSNEEIVSHSTEPLRPNKLQSPDLDSNTGHRTPSSVERNVTGSQERATGLEAANRPWRRKANIFKASLSKPTPNNAGPRSTPVSSQRHNAAKTQGRDRGKKTPDNDSSPVTQLSNNLQVLNGAETNNTIDVHAGVLREWVEQLQAEDVQRQSRAESRINVPKRQPRRLRTPPESWAKWPSHTREERTAPAGEKDNVSNWDFAVATNSSPSGILAEGKEQPKGREPAMASRTLSSQVGKALKSGWNKMIIHTGSLGRASDTVIADRHTIEPHKFLEYPELELVPTPASYREVQALDEQIGTMKRRSTSGGSAMRKSSSDGARRPLASRIAEEVHKFHTEDKNITWTDIDYHVKVPPGAQFLSPAQALFVPRSRSCDPELIGAPGLQATYEDCVQSQMLREDDDNDANRGTVKRARSTGNIEAKLPSKTLPTTDSGPTDKKYTSGLRRHKSLGWLRGNRRSSDRAKPISTKAE